MNRDGVVEREINIARNAHLYKDIIKGEKWGLGDKQATFQDRNIFVELTREECGVYLKEIEDKFNERIIGQEKMTHQLTVALALNEHVLIEGLPGVGKTIMIGHVAKVVGLSFKRVQFIPDMLPSDLIGKDYIDPVRLEEKSPEAVQWANGPLFSSLVLADEINRAPSKVQAALLEAMGENQITPFGKGAKRIWSLIHEAAVHEWWGSVRCFMIYGKKLDRMKEALKKAIKQGKDFDLLKSESRSLIIRAKENKGVKEPLAQLRNVFDNSNAINGEDIYIEDAGLDPDKEYELYIDRAGLFGLPAIDPDKNYINQFSVFATMNPIEQEGTYPLSEAQLDRFCFKINVPYPGRKHYQEISEESFDSERPKRDEIVSSQARLEEYKEVFRENPNALIPVLAPLYFFLSCRDHIFGGISRKRKGGANSLWKEYQESEEIKRIFDIVLFSDFRTRSSDTGEADYHLDRYSRESKDRIKNYLDDLKDHDKERHKRVQEIKDYQLNPKRYFQYIKAGSGPRGFLMLTKAFLCEVLLHGNNVSYEYIKRNAKEVLKHRIHLDVQARLENINTEDVVQELCDAFLAE